MGQKGFNGIKNGQNKTKTKANRMKHLKSPKVCYDFTMAKGIKANNEGYGKAKWEEQKDI